MVESEDYSEAAECGDIGSLPTLVLQEILAFILCRPMRIDAPSNQWLPILRLLCTRRGLASDAIEAGLQESIPSLDPTVAGKCTSWTALLAALRQGNAAWKLLQPLRAHRKRTQFSTALQKTPKISGSSLCFIGSKRIVLFGGRCSITGDTVNTSYVVHIPVRSAGVVQWEELHCSHGPPARCYHAAIQGKEDSNMFAFGGASNDLTTGSESLLADTWMLKVTSVPVDAFGAVASCGEWTRCCSHNSYKAPSARSSHICSAWFSPHACGVLHGGLGENGTLSDTWLLQPDRHWRELETSGPRVARAHHCGGVVQDHLLVYSGQDENYLTTHGLFMLQLFTAVWEEVACQSGPSPRIDAAVTVVESVGLLIFGGVGIEFEFEEPSVWVLPGTIRPDSQPRVMGKDLGKPCARACSSMCSDGLHAYVFGGFDGEQDLGDLWCLDLAPGCFGNDTSQCGYFLLPQVHAKHCHQCGKFPPAISRPLVHAVET